MNEMTKVFRKVGLFLGIILGIVLLLFIINQFVLFYNLLFGIHPYLGIGLTGLVVLLLAYLLIRIAIYWIKQPKILVLPEDPSPEEYDEYMDSMIKILKHNSNLSAFNWDDEALSKEQKVTSAFEILDDLSFPIIKENANSVFLTTAVSQNGSLDSIFVLISLIKMTWNLSKVYQTRPSIKSMGKLYIQIASVVFMARSIEDMDLIEDQIEPIIGSLISESLAAAVPGLKSISTLIFSMIMEGSINAFLTLRVGIAAQAYLGMEVPQSKARIRRSSSIKAVGYMGAVLKDNASEVIKSIGRAAKNSGSKTISRWKESLF